MRMNICFCLLTATMSTEAITLFMMATTDPAVEAILINKWFIAAIALLDLLVSLFSIVEIIFSSYLRFKGMTRLGYRFR